VLAGAPVAHAYNPSYSGGKNQEASPGKEFLRPYLKNTLHKIGLVEWLKVKALSSNPNTAKIS
jgi:hypothetical protein